MKEVTGRIDLKANKDKKKNINRITDFPLTSRLFFSELEGGSKNTRMASCKEAPLCLVVGSHRVGHD